MGILQGVDGPKKFVQAHGVHGTITELSKRAETIARQTPLDTDSWDDPEEWQMEAIELAHGFLAFINVLKEHGL